MRVSAQHGFRGPHTMRSLDEAVQYVRGVGPRGAERLGRAGIRTVWDLIRHIPRRYEDRTALRSIGELVPGQPSVTRGNVLAAEVVNTRRRGMQLTRVVIGDGRGRAELVFFRQPFLLKRFQQMMAKRRVVVVYGIPRFGPSGLSFEHPEWEELEPDEEGLSTGRLVPIYPLAEGLNQRWVRSAVASALESHAHLIKDPLPQSLQERYRLIGLAEAFRSIHLPATQQAADEARRRLVFDEFFLLQVDLAMRRASRASAPGVSIASVTSGEIETVINKVLPFKPTLDQESAIREIAADMRSGRQMNRLLHGDVGSGKTAVAVVAIVLTVRSGHQAAVMAPTEVLAQQQARVLGEWLGKLGVEVELATGSIGSRARTALRERMVRGEARVVVGTHALIDDAVRFKSLGLVIIDEQHRFGVLQRQALQAKGTAPHVLVMSATPIPRTLTLTLYGDLDLSVLRQMPPGRVPIKTHWKRPEQAASVYRAIAQLLDRGRQAYVVCPLVEESDKLEAAAATQHAERIAKEMLPGYRVGLLHGQMSPEAKEERMRAFKAGELDVLVSTTVIEVGIDVPNASVMVVEDADRFGLAQLHQLRGRVGRGQFASYCVLIADPRTEAGIRRLQVMTETSDGFRIAEEDLRLRGPGEYFGTRQSGIPEFRFADLLRDEPILIETRKAAAELVRDDPELMRPENRALNCEVMSRAASLSLAKVS